MRVLVGLASFGIAKNITMNLYEDDSYKSIIPEPKNESQTDELIPLDAIMPRNFNTQFVAQMANKGFQQLKMQLCNPNSNHILTAFLDVGNILRILDFLNYQNNRTGLK